MENKDPLERAPSFLAAFSHVIAAGFFENITFSAHCYEGKLSSCTLNAVAYIPNDPKYAAKGCGILVDPKDIVTKLREFASNGTLKSFFADVQTENWDLWDEEGENVVGSKGTKSTLVFTATLEIE